MHMLFFNRQSRTFTEHCTIVLNFKNPNRWRPHSNKNEGCDQQDGKHWNGDLPWLECGVNADRQKKAPSQYKEVMSINLSLLLFRKGRSRGITFWSKAWSNGQQLISGGWRQRLDSIRRNSPRPFKPFNFFSSKFKTFSIFSQRSLVDL